MTIEMMNDDRPIKMLLFNDEQGSMYEVGKQDCTKIEVYGEPGEHCMKPWVAVYVGGKISTRIPAGQVQIVYYG